MSIETAGKKWIRSNSANISNPYQGVPSIVFNQEIISSFQDGTISCLGGINSISENLSNPNEEFPLLSPETGETIGTSTYLQVYIMLSSLYSHISSK
jgi:hypothetical protein